MTAQFPAASTNGATPTWTYFSTTNPTGAIAPSFVYQFDGTANQYTERLGTGADMTPTAHAGDLPVNMGQEGITGVAMYNSGYLLSAAGVDVQIEGTLTIEALFALYEAETDAQGTLLCDGGAARYSYRVLVDQDNQELRLVWRTAAGGTITVYLRTCPVRGALQHLVITRGATGIVYCYLNGVQTFYGDGPHTLSGGCVANRLYIGTDTGLALDYCGAVFSVRLTAAEFTAAQALESYQQARGLA